MRKNELKEVILDQKERLGWNTNNISRKNEIDFAQQNNIISIITGIRRCGKSTLQNEIRYHKPESDYYINFDDERLFNIQLSDFQLLHEVFIELFGEQDIFYFDEIQNIDGWERFARRLHDYGKEIYITGSNASMLSRELGTHLTGRYLAYELFPFSFAEFLKFNHFEINDEKLYTTNGKASLSRLFNLYIDKGGFPEYLKNNNIEYLKTLYENILYRDIMVRHKLTNEREIKELLHYLASNITKLFSYNSLIKITGINSPTTIKQYINYFENSYLVFIINRFDYSIKKQIKNPKKCYLIDNGLIKAINFRFTDDKGRYLENLIFLELKRRGKEIYYHKETKECDFVIKKGLKIVEAVQVTTSMQDVHTEQRELEGLYDAMKTYDLETGTIITENEEDEIIFKSKKVKIIPVWKWLLQD